MTKRKLSDQQKKRIETHQRRAGEQGLRGRVVGRSGKTAKVMMIDQQILECHLRPTVPELTVGDWVSYDAATQTVIEALPRITELKRTTPFGKKLLAANIDQLMITFSTEPAFELSALDQYLVAAECLKIPAHIVINKIDLHPDIATMPWVQYYQKLNYPVHFVSALTGIGLENLRTQLQDRCSIFLGPSGVGKSSLLQSLLPEQTIKIGEISAASTLGKHTTTSSTWYPFGTGGIIDAPGIRDFTAPPPTRAELQRAFPEIQTAAEQCQFRNCQHQDELNCYVKPCVMAGNILSSRFEHFLKLRAVTP